MTSNGNGGNDVQQALEAFAKVPVLSRLDRSAIRVRRLGGLTNKVFAVQTPQAQYCLRLPGEGTEEYINRSDEVHAARQAAAAGVSPRVVFADADTGILVTDYLDGAITMSAEEFRSRNGAPARAGEAFGRLHGSGARFNFQFRLFSMIDEYLTILDGKPVELPDGYKDALESAETVRKALDSHALPLAPCHCDPLAENFLDTGQIMWIVDWEYSGMNDPLWDLGDLSVEAGFDNQQDEEMALAYFGRPPRPDEHGRIQIYKAMCDLLWTLWGLIQHANNNPAEDFWSYSINRFERCRKLMRSTEFPSYLNAVASGPNADV